MDDLRSGAAREPIDHSNHADVARGWASPELPRQGGGEGGQPAFRGRVGREESVAHGHRRAVSRLGRAPALPAWWGAPDPSSVLLQKRTLESRNSAVQ